METSHHVWLAALSDQAHSGVDLFAAQECVSLAFKAVVIHEELLEFTKKFLGQVAQPLDVGILMVHFRDSQQTIVANLLPSVCSPSMMPMRRADGDAGERGFIHQKQNVDGVAVGSKRFGQEPEVIREAHAGGENFLNGEDVLFYIEGEFVTAGFGSFDDDLDNSVALVHRLE